MEECWKVSDSTIRVSMKILSESSCDAVYGLGEIR